MSGSNMAQCLFLQHHNPNLLRHIVWCLWHGRLPQEEELSLPAPHENELIASWLCLLVGRLSTIRLSLCSCCLQQHNDMMIMRLIYVLSNPMKHAQYIGDKSCRTSSNLHRASLSRAEHKFLSRVEESGQPSPQPTRTNEESTYLKGVK